jgi:predicted dithiol-disulfide oxidoreductase (DUF899 family)
MDYADTKQQLDQLRTEISERRSQLRELQSAGVTQPVEDYSFTNEEGSVALSELFGEHDSLFVIHNMGAGCRYCSLWADGFSGLVDQLASRAAFVVSSPDSPATQRKLADKRGWRFRMVSHQDTSFAEDMGYTGEHGFEPGVSVFKRTADGVVRGADTAFGPGDDFCSIWHFFGMLPEGADGWQPLA